MFAFSGSQRTVLHPCKVSLGCKVSHIGSQGNVLTMDKTHIRHFYDGRHFDDVTVFLMRNADG